MKGATNIRNPLAAMAGGDFPTQAAELLAEMGYHSTRTLPGQSGDVADFLAHFPAANPKPSPGRAVSCHTACQGRGQAGHLFGDASARHDPRRACRSPGYERARRPPAS